MNWPYAASDSDTLADVAMKYWKNDLRSNLINNVPTTDDDPGFWQHMVTFGISIGLSGTRGWTSVEEAKNATSNRSWPTPSNDSPNNIDDLLHAAVNGHGQFVAASSPEAFSAGLSKALAAISQRTSSFSNVATNSTSLSTGAKVFSASYTSGTWVGALKAYPVSRSGVSTTPSWTATTLAFNTRKNKVFTYNGTAGAAFPTTPQRNQLDRSSVGPVDYPVTGAKNADYIVGDQSGEGSATGKLRVRSTVLGDVVNSSPAYVPDTDTVYVGANDGMLHAFDADDGKELFAYVPGIIDFTKLAKLSRGDYDHAFFVDGPVVVTSKAAWNSSRNILVGSLGRGGKGLYALNVTNPGSFNTGAVMWEKNDGNLGNILGAPILAQVRGSSNGAVIAGNGPNSATDRAFLVVRNLSNGGVIREIPTDSTIGNGLSAPIGVYAADGVTVIYAYAGDMQGNVWKFDMTNASPSAWTATKIFHAEKTAGTPQPITSGLAVAVDPATRKRWIFFGTGSYLSTADADDKTASAQSMYGFIDDGGSYNRSNLTPRSVTVSGDYRYFDSKAALPSTSKGWYVDLPGNGERIVQNAQING
ncbi:MAG: pilus assembly protein, partial [Achromobacter pestifer]